MANIRKHRDWDRPGIEITPEQLYLTRRTWLKAAGVAGAGMLAPASTLTLLAGCSDTASAQTAGSGRRAARAIPKALRDLYPAKRNPAYIVEGRTMTPESVATSYNNFYEFDPMSKTAPAHLVANWKVRPWEVQIGGLVKNPVKIDADDLARKMGLEERVYRLRCVEAWSMVIPWTGFEMRKLINWVEPLGSAKFVRFVSFLDPEAAPGQNNKGYRWPYYEALRLDEAMNPLALFVTGMYGKPLPKQSGAPIRAIVPWKYGYKSPKSIVKIEFVEKQPHTFWNDQAPNEYSFLSNVDPKVPHPRWSQETERVVGQAKRIPTLPYNGYAEQVAQLYK